MNDSTRDRFTARLLEIGSDTSVPGWLRAAAAVAAYDVSGGCAIPATTDDLTVGAWLGARLERRRHEPATPDNPEALTAWAKGGRSG